MTADTATVSTTQTDAPSPTPPRNVRIAYPDGRTVPMECHYKGLHGDIHVWAVVVPSVAVLGRGFRLEADPLPPRTALSLEVAR